MTGPSAPARAWATSGAMALTGPDVAPLAPPDELIARIRHLGRALGLDPLPLLAERAAATGFTRHGPVSGGEAARLLPAADGWLAVNLPRDDDVVSLAAWLELDAPVRAGRDQLDDSGWATVGGAIRSRRAAELVERATLLGLAVSRMDEVPAPTGSPLDGLPLKVEGHGDRPALTTPPTVVDLSSLWAGPVCARLLREHGADVIKVESVARPDGARRGPSAFFDRLHAGAQAVSVDLATGEGVQTLQALLSRADVVIEASRRRALEQVGIESSALLVAPGGPKVWASITGYGRASDRIAFGDDAAVAGGLVAFDGDQPCFVADAVADPLTGVATASAIHLALRRPGRWRIDASMAGVSAYVAGDDARRWRRVAELVASAPELGRTSGHAPALGADNDRLAL